MDHVGVFYAQKGGTGKTTLVSTLAEYYSQERGIPTLMLDMDGQRTLSAIYDATAGVTIQDVMAGKRTIAQAMQEVKPNLWLVPSSSALYEWTYTEEGVFGLRRLLANTRLAGMLKLIDPAPAFTPLSKTVLAASTFLVIPTQPTANDILSLRSLLLTLQELRGEEIGGESLIGGLNVLGVVINRYSWRFKLHRGGLESIRQSPFSLFKSMIAETVAVQEASNYGASIVTYRPRHKVAEQFRELGEEIAACLGI